MQAFSPNATAFLVALANDTGLDPAVIAAWMLAEEPVGGSSNPGTGNQNWLNIGFFDSGPGAITFSSAFSTPRGAADFTTKFLKGSAGGASSGIRAILNSVGKSPQEQIRAIQVSGWASSGYPDLPGLYASIDQNWIKGLGIKPGGAAGLGGTGTGANAQPKVAFTVGDVSNPHEDYWTAINRLSQDRYWYLFSDAETLYLADGTHLMKQNPVATVAFGDERVNHIEWLWDNTAFNYASDHKRHGSIQRKSHIAKVSSPVEVQLQLICKVDEFRAGDVITFQGFGAGDGKWLIGDAKRSVFSVMSELTLVPAVAPLSEDQVAGASTKNTSSTTGAPSSGGAALSGSSSVPGHPELQAGISRVVNTVLHQFPSLVITSTTGGGHASGSYHFLGRAADLAGPNMDSEGAWIQQNLTSELTEGIHNPTLSVKDKHVVGSGFWGASTWAAHTNHIHLAV